MCYLDINKFRDLGAECSWTSKKTLGVSQVKIRNLDYTAGQYVRKWMMFFGYNVTNIALAERIRQYEHSNLK